MSSELLDFSEHVKKLNEVFFGRNWVFEKIDSWLNDPSNPRILLISGEPGVGKSAILAQVVQNIKPDAYHFCIARQANTIDPLNFARSISMQLCQNLEFAKNILQETGVTVEITQNIQENFGTVIGIQIDNLLVEAPSPVVAFNRLVRDPLIKLYSDGYEEKILIVVDSLDEAETHSSSEKINGLLSSVTDLPEKVRFILTARSNSSATKEYIDKSESIEIETNSKNNTDDINGYIKDQNTKSSRFRDGLDKIGWTIDRFLVESFDKHQGNFRYLALLFAAIEKDESYVNNLSELPPGLDGIYYEHLRTRSIGDKKIWRAYRPVLGILSVAQTPLTIEQIEKFSKEDQQTIWDILNDAGEFLDTTKTNPPVYSLYHQSLVDFLGDQESAKDYWIDFNGVHKKIAETYRGDADWNVPGWNSKDWSSCDIYGLNYLSYHLQKGKLAKPLRNLICQEWMDKHYLTDQFTYTGFIKDVHIAWDTAIQEGLPEVDLVHLKSAEILAIQLVTIYNDTDLKTLVLLGRKNEALAHARLRPTPLNRFDGLFAIYCELQMQKDEIDSILSELLSSIGLIPEPPKTLWKYDELIKWVSSFDSQRAEMLLQKQIEYCRIISAQNPEFRKNELRLLIKQAARKHQWKKAEELILQLDGWDKCFGLIDIVEYLTLAGEKKYAEEIFQRAFDEMGNNDYLRGKLRRAMLRHGYVDFVIEHLCGGEGNQIDTIRDLIRHGAIDQAIRLVESYTPAMNWRDAEHLLAETAHELANIGDGRARNFLDQINLSPESLVNSEGFDNCIGALVFTGSIEKADEIVRLMPDNIKRGERGNNAKFGFLVLVNQLIADGRHLQKALEIINQGHLSQGSASTALSDLAYKFAENGNLIQANELLQRRSSEKISPDLDQLQSAIWYANSANPEKYIEKLLGENKLEEAEFFLKAKIESNPTIENEGYIKFLSLMNVFSKRYKEADLIRLFNMFESKVKYSKPDPLTRAYSIRISSCILDNNYDEARVIARTAGWFYLWAIAEVMRKRNLDQSQDVYYESFEIADATDYAVYRFLDARQLLLAFELWIRMDEGKKKEECIHFCIKKLSELSNVTKIHPADLNRLEEIARSFPEVYQQTALLSLVAQHYYHAGKKDHSKKLLTEVTQMVNLDTVDNFTDKEIAAGALQKWEIVYLRYIKDLCAIGCEDDAIRLTTSLQFYEKFKKRIGKHIFDSVVLGGSIEKIPSLYALNLVMGFHPSIDGEILDELLKAKRYEDIVRTYKLIEKNDRTYIENESKSLSQILFTNGLMKEPLSILTNSSITTFVYVLICRMAEGENTTSVLEHIKTSLKVFAWKQQEWNDVLPLLQ